MIRFWRRLALGMAAWSAAAGLAMSAPDPGAAAPSPGEAPRQVLVMLRLPPDHTRPNSDYGGAYGDGMGRSARRRIAAKLARRFDLTLVDDWPMPLLGVDCFVLAVPAGRSPEQVAAVLSKEAVVEWSEPMNVYRAQGEVATHNDPLYPVQPAAREWRLAELHQYATGRNVRVAVIDSRIEASHPDLVGQVEISRDFVPDHAAGAERHGTNVAGIIAARADNGIGIAGVAPGARLLALRACWQLAETSAEATPTICDSLGLAKALEFAITHDARVINLSLSGPSDLLLGKLLDVAEVRHIVIVGAFDRDAPGGGFPASHAGVVAVADEAWGRPPRGVYSAPSRDIPTTTPGGQWTLVNGSSFGAAHVSGLYALLLERGPQTNAPVRLVAQSSGDGAIDACATLLRGTLSCDCGCSRLVEAATAGRR